MLFAKDVFCLTIFPLILPNHVNAMIDIKWKQELGRKSTGNGIVTYNLSAKGQLGDS